MVDPGSIPGSGRSPWRRKWQPTPVFLPGESHGRRRLVGYSPWGHKKSDTTEQLHFHFFQHPKELRGFPGCTSGKEPAFQGRRCTRHRFNSWVGKILWRRERLLTPVFWLGEFHGLYSPWVHKELDMTELLSLHFGQKTGPG